MLLKFNLAMYRSIYTRFHKYMNLLTKRSLRSYGEEIACFLIVSLFLYASISKLIEYDKFQSQIGQSPMLTGFAATIAWLIPVIEVIISMMLLIPRFRTLGFYCAFSLMVLFTAYIFSILKFSDYIPCSCGGILSKMGWTEHLVFNVVYIIICAYGSLVHYINSSEASKQDIRVSSLQN
jgi:uncharacterized membrane protein YphA (DoxX/SURF4 family)